MADILNPRRVATGLVEAYSSDAMDDYGTQVWSECTSRQRSKCVVSGSPIQPGDRVYRPVTNKANRSWRVLALVMNEAVPHGVPGASSNEPKGGA